MVRKKITGEEQMSEILSTELYQSGASFTTQEMLENCTKTKCKSRMTMLLRGMIEMGHVRRHKQDGLYHFIRAPVSLLKKRWISEEAEALCQGNIARTLTGQAARDAFVRSRALAGTGQTSCGGSL